MVNKDRLKAKLPALLVDGPLTENINYLEYRRFDYQLRKLQKRKPAAIDQAAADLARILENLADLLG